MKFYLYIAALAVFDLTAVVAVKFWYLKNQIGYLVAGMLAFAITAIFMGLALKYQGVAIVNVIWVALSVITTTIAGYYFFKEPIAPYQFIGIVIVIIGLIIVEWR